MEMKHQFFKNTEKSYFANFVGDIVKNCSRKTTAKSIIPEFNLLSSKCKKMDMRFFFILKKKNNCKDGFHDCFQQ